MQRCGLGRTAGVFVLVLACLHSPSGARAQQAPAAATAPPSGSAGSPTESVVEGAAESAAESPQYRALVDAALQEFERANWTEAYALFLRAHALSPSARTLRGLSVCAFEAKKYLRAIDYMRAALDDPRKALDDAQRREAATLIERAQVFVARLALAVDPAAARVEVDAVLAARDDQDRVLLDPGVHQLTFSLAGYLTETRSVSVSPGDELHLAVQLAPAPLAAATAANATPSGPAREPAAPPATHASLASDATPLRTWAWVSAAGSVVLAGAGATLFVLGKDGVRDIEKACPKGACTSDELERRIDQRDLVQLQVGSILGFALAGASAVVSTILFASASDDGDERPTARTTGTTPSLQARF